MGLPWAFALYRGLTGRGIGVSFEIITKVGGVDLLSGASTICQFVVGEEEGGVGRRDMS